MSPPGDDGSGGGGGGGSVHLRGPGQVSRGSVVSSTQPTSTPRHLPSPALCQRALTLDTRNKRAGTFTSPSQAVDFVTKLEQSTVDLPPFSSFFLSIGRFCVINSHPSGTNDLIDVITSNSPKICPVHKPTPLVLHSSNNALLSLPPRLHRSGSLKPRDMLRIC
ncbi:hypothetical protein E2C01_023149 [Portunus trituberculatus]|uniref:Uncharacterized protein n=1 Tax=Portunus trituberculatus TaxID=210409 RepID=A0A5B7E964_PORTR|nr:hypothetical protein [Portunus trituberculatus]